jgi:hypothetical protein
MKILQVVPYFPPAYAFGGPVKATYQISKELIERDLSIERKSQEMIAIFNDTLENSFKAFEICP